MVPDCAAGRRSRAICETTIAEDNFGAIVHLKRTVAVVRAVSARRVVVVVETSCTRSTKEHSSAVALSPNLERTAARQRVVQSAQVGRDVQPTNRLVQHQMRRWRTGIGEWQRCQLT